MEGHASCFFFYTKLVCVRGVMDANAMEFIHLNDHP
jgi:hypothetical protein